MDGWIKGEEAGRHADAEAASSAAFPECESGLDTDAGVKLNCDEAEVRQCKATQTRVREDGRGDNQGHRLC